LKKFAHEPFAKGDCSSCHQAHQSENAMLLRGGEKSAALPDLSIRYEREADERRPRRISRRRKIALVPQPALNRLQHQLKEEQTSGCFDCHKGLKAKIKNAPVQHAALKVGEQCANCHDPHGSNEKSLLLARTDSRA
jgi:predicted CXXCH cytochrome family protein